MNIIRNWKVKQNHDRCQFRSQIRFRNYKKRKNKNLVGVSLVERTRIAKELERFRNYEHIKAPANFSLINNTEEMLRFIAALNRAFEKHRKVYVKLHKLKSMTDDAIVLLLSNVLEFKNAKIDFNGSRPYDVSIARRLEKSGFFDILYGKRKNA